MTSLWVGRTSGPTAKAGAAALLLLAFHGCSLDKVTIPDLSGPSELGTAVTLTVNPDVLTADGHSTSAVQATVHNQNGQLVSGRQVFFTIASSTGLLADIGTLSSTTATTGTNGIAQVIYKAPARTDATANQSVIIAARPVTNDANGAIYRQARIELRSAEPHLFPQNPANCVGTLDGCPAAFIVVEPSTGGTFKPGNQILFQGSGSTDTPDQNGRTGVIVRYEWDFGDGMRDDKPDVNHAFLFPGVYTVTLVVTDDEGAQGFAQVTVTVQ